MKVRCLTCWRKIRVADDRIKQMTSCRNCGTTPWQYEVLHDDADTEPLRTTPDAPSSRPISSPTLALPSATPVRESAPQPPRKRDSTRSSAVSAPAAAMPARPAKVKRQPLPAKKKKSTAFVIVLWGAVLLVGVLIPWGLIAHLSKEKREMEMAANAIPAVSEVKPTPPPSVAPVTKPDPKEDVRKQAIERFNGEKKRLMKELEDGIDYVEGALGTLKGQIQAFHDQIAPKLTTQNQVLETLKRALGQAQDDEGKAFEALTDARNALADELDKLDTPLKGLMTAHEQYLASLDANEKVARDLAETSLALEKAQALLQTKRDEFFEIESGIEDAEGANDEAKKSSLAEARVLKEREVEMASADVARSEQKYTESKKSYDTAGEALNKALDALSYARVNVDGGDKMAKAFVQALSTYEQGTITHSEQQKKMDSARAPVEEAQKQKDAGNDTYKQARSLSIKLGKACDAAVRRFDMLRDAARGSDGIGGGGDWAAVREAETAMEAAKSKYEQQKAIEDETEKIYKDAAKALTAAQKELSKQEGEAKKTKTALDKSALAVQTTKSNALKAIESQNKAQEPILKQLRAAVEQAQKLHQDLTDAATKKQEEHDAAVSESKELQAQYDLCARARTETSRTIPWLREPLETLKKMDNTPTQYDLRKLLEAAEDAQSNCEAWSNEGFVDAEQLAPEAAKSLRDSLERTGDTLNDIVAEVKRLQPHLSK